MLICSLCDSPATLWPCGQALCNDHYREHLNHEPSIGIHGCLTCANEEWIANTEQYAEIRRGV